MGNHIANGAARKKWPGLRDAGAPLAEAEPRESGFAVVTQLYFIFIICVQAETVEIETDEPHTEHGKPRPSLPLQPFFPCLSRCVAEPRRQGKRARKKRERAAPSDGDCRRPVWWQCAQRHSGTRTDISSKTNQNN